RMAGEADRQVSALRRLLRSEPMIHFVGADLDSFGDLVELRFQAGDPQQAWQALAGGDAVIVAKEFSNSFGKGLGETVALQTPGGQVHRFRIVGIVDSPGIEVATDFFDQRSAYQRRALGALIGTRRDCRRIFGTDLVNLLLFNFSFEGELDRAARASAERAIITRMAQRIGLGRAAIRRPPGTDEFSFAYFLRQGLGYVAFSARELKLLIEQDFRRGILWLVFAAAVALAVAALGVANGMMANIASRAKQIAILRAIGMTRGQVVRMVLAEALTLGLIGAVFGLVLGLYLASVANWIDYRLFGFEPILSIPWSWIAAGIGLTVGGCLVAGLLPILSAARSNIVDALRLA
ncbi:MAG: ABC transporter permease, partial [Phycisphaerae bacterium]